MTWLLALVLLGRTTTCGEIKRWYNDVDNAGNRTCCSFRGGKPEDVRTLPREEWAMLIFRNKPFPIAWDTSVVPHTATWGPGNDVVAVRLEDPTLVPLFLAHSKNVSTQLLVPYTPSILLHLRDPSSAASLGLEGYLYVTL